jgi:hypothetical protein
MSTKYTKGGNALIGEFAWIAINGSCKDNKKNLFRMTCIKESKIALKEKMRIMETYKFSFVNKLSIALHDMTIQNSKPFNVLKRMQITQTCFQLINEHFDSIQKNRSATEGDFRKFCRFYRTAMSKGIEIQQCLDKRINEGVPRLKSSRQRFMKTYNIFKEQYYANMYREFQTVIPKNPLNDDVMRQIYDYL